MSYFRMDHAGWIRSALKIEPSPLGTKVATILGIVGGGIYNAPIRHEGIDWTATRFIPVVWRGGLDTWDFNRLTTLVLLCHEARIRCDVEPRSPQYLRLCFTQRSHEGGISSRHPNIDEAIASFRAALGPDHPVSYRTPAAPETAA